jgi:hypothetical protein
MPSYEEVTQRARSLRSVTGVTDKAFQALLPHFEQAFEAYMGNRTIKWAAPHEPPVHDVCQLSLTHDG